MLTTKIPKGRVIEVTLGEHKFTIVSLDSKATLGIVGAPKEMKIKRLPASVCLTKTDQKR